ncbi:hypothetical protein EVA_14391 [gut metagenome]|uniref:Uncharacterized protein n=1 Tax=gut metagenome TaxID=749906 RepID=J9G6T7_9ZZZZ
MLPVSTHPVVFGRTVDYGEVQLFFCCIQTEHQVEYHFIHFIRAAVGFVYLVDYHNRFQTDFQGFLQNKASLRHRAFKRVYQQDTSVCHVQHTFHFTAEVAVPRSVDDVNFGAVVVDGYVFGKNGYTPFALQVVVIQDKVTTILVVAEIARQQHLVNQCCFPMVYMGNDCNVSNVLHIIPIICLQRYEIRIRNL